MIKFYDTNALLDLQEDAIEKNSKFLISNITLNELEQIKTSGTRDEEIKWAARQVLQILSKHTYAYDTILYRPLWNDDISRRGFEVNNDTKIIISAFNAFNKYHGLNNGIFITSDLSCKMIAQSIGLKTQFPKLIEDDEYSGYFEIKFNDQELSDFYSKTIPNNDNIYDLYQNEYILIKDNTDKIIDKYAWTGEEYRQIKFCCTKSEMFGKIVPYNGDHYQQIALDSLENNQITMLRGPAGSGKSYLAFGYMFQLLEKSKIDKIIVFCNTVATKGSAKLGFYPGSRTEKLLDSQIGNLLISKLGDRFIVEDLIDTGKLILLPLSDIRGYDTTGMNAAIYISEAQNLDIELMRLALQRVGEDSICILDGDSATQVDLSMYAGAKNGMRRVSQVFRGAEMYGEVTLKNIHRSRIAALAQNM